MQQRVRGSRKLPKTRRMPKIGVLVVDMQEFKHSGVPGRVLGYQHGEVETGIRRVCDVLEVAKQLGLPIMVTEYLQDCEPSKIADMAGTDTITEIKAALDGYAGARYFPKIEPDMFSDRFCTLGPYLDALDLDIVAVEGFNLTACIRSAIERLLERKIQVATSGEVLFIRAKGMSLWKQEFIDESIAGALQFYRKRTTWFETANELAEFIRSSAS